MPLPFLAFSSAFTLRLFAFSRKHFFAHFFLFSSNVAMKNDAKSSTNSFTFSTSAFSIVSSFSNNAFLLMRFNSSISFGVSVVSRCSPSASFFLLFFADDDEEYATPFLSKTSLKTSLLSNDFANNSSQSISYVTGFPRWSSGISRNSRFFFFGLLVGLGGGGTAAGCAGCGATTGARGRGKEGGGTGGGAFAGAFFGCGLANNRGAFANSSLPFSSSFSDDDFTIVVFAATASVALVNAFPSLTIVVVVSLQSLSSSFFLTSSFSLKLAFCCCCCFCCR